MDACTATEQQMREQIERLTAARSAWCEIAGNLSERCIVLVDQFAALEAERDALRDTMALHEVGSAYAHRLAVLLECALLDPTGTWGDAHALLDEYRAACRAVNPEPPTFMGEPVVDAARKETPNG